MTDTQPHSLGLGQAAADTNRVKPLDPFTLSSNSSSERASCLKRMEGAQFVEKKDENQNSQLSPTAFYGSSKSSQSSINPSKAKPATPVIVIDDTPIIYVDETSSEVASSSSSSSDQGAKTPQTQKKPTHDCDTDPENDPKAKLRPRPPPGPIKPAPRATRKMPASVATALGLDGSGVNSPSLDKDKDKNSFPQASASGNAAGSSSSSAATTSLKRPKSEDDEWEVDDPWAGTEEAETRHSLHRKEIPKEAPKIDQGGRYNLRVRPEKEEVKVVPKVAPRKKPKVEKKVDEIVVDDDSEAKESEEMDRAMVASLKDVGFDIVAQNDDEMKAQMELAVAASLKDIEGSHLDKNYNEDLALAAALLESQKLITRTSDTAQPMSEKSKAELEAFYLAWVAQNGWTLGFESADSLLGTGEGSGLSKGAGWESQHGKLALKKINEDGNFATPILADADSNEEGAITESQKVNLLSTLLTYVALHNVNSSSIAETLDAGFQQIYATSISNADHALALLNPNNRFDFDENDPIMDDAMERLEKCKTVCRRLGEEIGLWEEGAKRKNSREGGEATEEKESGDQYVLKDLEEDDGEVEVDEEIEWDVCYSSGEEDVGMEEEGEGEGFVVV